MKILLIDDEVGLDGTLESILSRDNEEILVLQEYSCDEGFKALESGIFDIVILDKDLRRGKGINCLKKLRKQYPDVPIVMLIDREAEELMSECMEEGADDFVDKEKIQTLLAHVIWSAVHRRLAKLRILATTAIRKAELDRIGRLI